MIDYDVGLMPVVSKFDTVWYLRHTDKNVCFHKRVSCYKDMGL